MPVPERLAKPDGQVINEILRAAVAGPSPHNTQPWRFVVRDGGARIELRADPARLLTAADRDGRAAHIACGAALFNLRMAAAVSGLRPGICLMPDPRQPLLLAEIRLTGGHHATAREAALFAAVYRRHTNREPFSEDRVPPGLRVELVRGARAEGGFLDFADDDEAARLLRLAADAERELMADPAYRAELTRWTGEHRDDGVPASTFGPRSASGRNPVRDFGAHRHQPVQYAWFEESPQLAVLSAPADGARYWLAAGQALEHVWLAATQHGLSICPLTQPLETREAWLVRDPRSGSGKPQMILRLGYGLAIDSRTPRRPLSSCVDWR